MNILITGSTGYIGRKLAEHLVDKHHLVLYVRDREKLSSKLSSCTVVTSLEEVGQVDIIFHVAALKNTKSTDGAYFVDLVQSNILLSMKMYALAKERDIPIVFISSFSQYLDKDAYCVTKQAVECLVTYVKDFNKYTFVRLTDTYGEDDVRPKLINLMKLAKEKDERIFIQSAPDKLINVTHVDDVVLGLEYIMKHSVYGIVDLIYEETLTTIGELAETVGCKAIYGKEPSGEPYLVPTDKNRLKGFTLQKGNIVKGGYLA